MFYDIQKKNSIIWFNLCKCKLWLLEDQTTDNKWYVYKI